MDIKTYTLVNGELRVSITWGFGRGHVYFVRIDQDSVFWQGRSWREGFQKLSAARAFYLEAGFKQQD